MIMKVQVEHRGQKIMSKCFDNKNSFPGLHRHFCPAIGISQNCPILCRDPELKKSNFKNKACLDTQHVNDTFAKSLVFEKKKIRAPM